MSSSITLSHKASSSETFAVIIKHQEHPFIVWKHDSQIHLYSLVTRATTVVDIQKVFFLFRKMLTIQLKVKDGVIIAVPCKEIPVPVFILQSSEKSLVVQIQETKGSFDLITVQSMELLKGASEHYASNDVDADAFALAHISLVPSQSQTVVQWTDLKNPHSHGQYAIDFSHAQHGDIGLITLSTFARDDGSTGIRLYFTTADGMVHFYQDQKRIWTKDESLSVITSSAFVPLARSEAPFLSMFANYSCMQNRRSIWQIPRQCLMISHFPCL